MTPIRKDARHRTLRESVSPSSGYGNALDVGNTLYVRYGGKDGGVGCDRYYEFRHRHALIVGLSKVKRLAGPQNGDLHDQVP